MTEHYDVVICGGAIMGSACAYFLTRDPSFDGRVLVIERDPTYQACSTTLSAGSIRQQFSTPLNIAASQFGIEFLRNVNDWLDEETCICLREDGYLLLAGPTGLPILSANHAVQTQCGANIEMLAPDQLHDQFPWMNLDGVSAGCRGVDSEGWFDAYGLLQGFRRKARSRGAAFINGEVAGLRIEGQRIGSVTLADGQQISCGDFINTAGPAAAKITAMAGITLPVESRKRFVFVFDCHERDQITNCPLVVDPSGLYFRPEGNHFITGISPSQDDPDPECWDYDVNYDLFNETIWPILANRVPAFNAIKMINAWAGHYAYNLFDQNAIVGRHPLVNNFIFANGFTGHGLQQAPAVGRGIAELVIHNEYRALDLFGFAFERITQNHPLREQNVI